MRILCITPSSEWMPYSLSHGLIPTLQRLGHEPKHLIVPDTDFKPIARYGDAPLREARESAKRTELVLVTAAEKIDTAFWKDAPCPKALWFTDATGRKDTEYTPRYLYCQSLTPHLFFPAAQDAQSFSAHFLPFGVDVSIFHPMPEVKKQHGPSFIGHLYGARKQWLLNLRSAGLQIETPDTTHPHWLPNHRHARARASELARLYNACTHIINLPAACQVYGTRVTEAMACGIPLLNPTFPDFAAENRNAFLHPPREYDPRDPSTLRELLWCTHKLESHAKVCLQEVLARHTLEAKLQTLIQQTFKPTPRAPATSTPNPPNPHNHKP